MPGYTKGAATVIQALQTAQDEGETIWSAVALLTIADLSPLDSAMARVLRSDVWNETMRKQLRAGMSGKPGTDYLRPRSMSGFRLNSLLERAEKFRDEAGDSLVGERHLAMALSEMLRDDLRTQAISSERLVQEVTTLELSPQREKVERAREWERLRFSKEQDGIWKDIKQQSEVMRSRFAQAGHGPGSGMIIKAVTEIHVAGLQRMAEIWLQTRRDLVRQTPDLATPEHLEALGREISGMIEAQWANLHIAVARWVGGVSQEADIRRTLDSGEWQDTPLRIKSYVGREIEMIKREASLGMHEPARPGVIISIQGSTVAALNLGNVMGNIQSVIVSLEDSGNRELAEGLKNLIEKVAAAEELGSQRRDVIDSLTVIGEEAAKPQTDRRTGVARSLMRSVGAALGHVANLAQIWTALAPLIERHFGI